MNIDDVTVIHDGTYVAVLLCALGEGEEAVQLGKERSIFLNWGDELGKCRDELVEELCLEGKDALLCTHDFLLVRSLPLSETISKSEL